jgi:hypothetical protein
MYLCPDMTPRRIISFLVAATLLLSLMVPPSAGAHSCGEAARMTVKAAAAKKPHGCVGCSKSKGKRVEPRTTHTLKATAAGIPFQRAGAMLCCNDGQKTRQSTVDVPTLTVPISPLAATLMALSELWFPSATLAARPIVGSFKIGASPPFLAAVHQHTYLRTSVFLI